MLKKQQKNGLKKTIKFLKMAKIVKEKTEAKLIIETVPKPVKVTEKKPLAEEKKPLVEEKKHRYDKKRGW